jgi:hypothetical protein
MVEDIESPSPRRFDREPVPSGDVLDDHEQLVALRVPEEGDIEVVVSAVCQLGHLDLSSFSFGDETRMRRTVQTGHVGPPKR